MKRQFFWCWRPPVFISIGMMAAVIVNGQQAGSGSGSREKRLTRQEAAKQTDVLDSRTARIALLVGIGDYDPALTGLNRLSYPVSDITEVGKELKQQGYAISILTDKVATAAAVRDAIKELAQALDPDRGTFLFYFSGHGYRVDNTNYLATYGTTNAGLADQGLSVQELQLLLQATHARQRLAIIDACRNDPNARGIGPQRAFSELEASEGLRVLYSTGPGKVSYEDDELQHGVFSHYVIRGLRGEAAGTDGLITFDDLQEYVTREMKDYGVPRRRIQIPYQAGESTGDFLLARAAPKAAKPWANPNTGTSSSTATQVGAVQVQHAAQTREPTPAAPRSALKQTSGSLEVELGTCLHRGERVLCDLRVKNLDDDRKYMLLAQAYETNTRMIDSRGNMYAVDEVQLGNDTGRQRAETLLPSETAVSGVLTFMRVPADVNLASLIEIRLTSDWNDRPGSPKFQFKGIPIEGATAASGSASAPRDVRPIAKQASRSLELELVPCLRRGEKVVCDFRVRNLDDDKKYLFLGQAYETTSRMIDDRGSVYAADDVQLGNGSGKQFAETILPSGTPVLGRLTFASVPLDISSVSLELRFTDDWNNRPGGPKFQLKVVPIESK